MKKSRTRRSLVSNLEKPNHGSYVARHDDLVRETLIHLGKYAHEFGRFFNNPTGVAYRDEVWGRKWIEYGVEGSGDIYGFTLTGQIIYLEAKTGNATQSPNQVKFEAMVKKFGGLYFVFRSKEEALECVLRAVSCNSRQE